MRVRFGTLAAYLARCSFLKISQQKNVTAKAVHTWRESLIFVWIYRGMSSKLQVGILNSECNILRQVPPSFLSEANVTCLGDDSAIEPAKCQITTYMYLSNHWRRYFLQVTHDELAFFELVGVLLSYYFKVWRGSGSVGKETRFRVIWFKGWRVEVTWKLAGSEGDPRRWWGLMWVEESTWYSILL